MRMKRLEAGGERYYSSIRPSEDPAWLAWHQPKGDCVGLCCFVCLGWHTSLLCAPSIVGFAGLWFDERADIFCGGSRMAEIGSLYALVVLRRRDSARHGILFQLRSSRPARKRSVRNSGWRQGERLFDGDALESANFVVFAFLVQPGGSNGHVGDRLDESPRIFQPIGGI